jgi:hypothetical protein
MTEEESNFCALAVFARLINQLEPNGRARKWQRQKSVRR